MSLKLVKKIDFPSDILVLSLFGLYSLTLAPTLNKFLSFGEKNPIVALIGILIYIFEIFAFKYKLFAIRIKAEESRIAARNNTGEERLLPRAGLIVWIGVFARMVFRLGILFLSIHAAGISIRMSGEGSSIMTPMIMFSAVFFEFFLVSVFMIRSGLFNPELRYKREALEELESYKIWTAQYQNAKADDFFYFKEVLSDVVLNIYAFMLYNGIWDRINAVAMRMIDQYFEIGETALNTGANVFSWLFFLILFALPTLRLTSWLEGRVLAFDRKSQWNIRLTFLVAALITIAPTILYFREVFFGKA